MYYMLIGTVYKKEESRILLNVNNVVYDVNMSENSLKELKESDMEVNVYLLEKITEVSHDLFGFIDMEEKRLFEKIIKIPKVGHKTAMNVFNEFSPNELIEKISAGDIKALKKIKGFGEKGIMSLMHELRNERIEIDNSYLKVKDKLLELGMKEDEIDVFLRDKKDWKEDEIIKECLKGLV